MPPRRAAASAAVPKSTRSSRGRATELKAELGSESETIGVAPQKTATKRTSSAKSSANARNRGRETVSKQQITEQSSEDGDSVASEVSESPTTKRPSRPRSGIKTTRKSKQPTTSSKKFASSRRVETASEGEGEPEHDTLEVDQPKPKSSIKRESAQPPSMPDDSLRRSGRRNSLTLDSTEEDRDDVGAAKRTSEQDAPEPAHDAVPEVSADPSSEDEEDLLPQVSLRASAAPPSRVGHTSILSSRAARSSLRHSVLPPTEIETGPKSRLVIHKMALVNFKSYKGRQEIGPFHKSFSAIVGPNGSGKSNTIDALLFVFGYRASKMRQGKLSELIHNSVGPSTSKSKKKKAQRHPSDSETSEDETGNDGYQGGIESCSVEVHFREIVDLPGPDAFTVVPDSQLVVARTAYRNNKSDYMINSRTSSFTEVTTLLKARGIDLDHKRFLILQGEVESIAQMKPKAPSEHEDGLLEYLEDIIGTSKYKNPIEECNQEVEQLNEDRQSKLNRLRHVEKEKSRLEAEKREVEDALRDQNALVRAQSLLAQYYIYQALKNVESYKADLGKLEAKLAHEMDKNKDDIIESENLQAQYEDRAAQYDVVKKETAKLTKDLAAHEKEEVKLQEKKKHVVSKQKKLKKSIAEDTHTKNEADGTIETLTTQLQKRKTELDALEAELEREEAELEVIQEGLKDKTLPFQRQIESKQKDLAPWTTKVNAKQSEVDLAQSERAMLAEKATGAQAAVDEAVSALEKLRADRSSKESEIAVLNRERKNLEKQVKEGEAKLANITEQSQKLRSKVSSARQKVDEAKASQAASTSQNAVLDSLTRLRASGRINGFHGRLGSLGTIPDKYDVAVSTACPALNNLVVDTVEQGQACIEYLRKQNVGRASFFVLEKLPTDGRLNRIATPEDVPRLFDLIKPKDPKFAPAFYKGLGNTLVASDLEQAKRVAYGQSKRWRVVTLDGALIDTSGTMSGGGNKVAKGAMSSKLASDAVEPAVLQRYEADSESLQTGLDALLTERQETENEVERLQRQLPTVDLAIQKLELDIRNAGKRMQEDERRIKELSTQVTPNAADAKRIKALEATISASTSELKKLLEKSSAIESDIKGLQDKILEIGGVRLRSQKSKVDGVKEQIDHINETITRAEVGKAKAEHDSEKLDGALASAVAALGDLDGELEVLEEELAVCNEDLANVATQVEKAQTIADSAKEDLAEMKAELDEKMVLINKFRAKEMELKQKTQDKTKAMKEDDAKIQHWSNFHDKLKLHEIDDEEEEEEEEVEPATAEQEAEVENREETDDVKQESHEGRNKPRERQQSEKLELEVFRDEALAVMDLSEIKADVAALEERVRNARPNMGLLAEYRKREAEFLDRAKDLDEITAARDNAKARFDQFRKTRLEEFMTGFNTISSKLKEMYQMITLGGNAELELVDSLDPFSEGIIFSVMPPKKSWKNISNLSGGEKTLSSLALVFALHVYKPTPLYFMDEIDAALDFRNVSIVANYIKDRTKNAQFIIISLRNDMFELSHRLIGIYKTSNATRSVSIDNHLLTPAAAPLTTAA